MESIRKLDITNLVKRICEAEIEHARFMSLFRAHYDYDSEELYAGSFESRYKKYDKWRTDQCGHKVRGRRKTVKARGVKKPSYNAKTVPTAGTMFEKLNRSVKKIEKLLPGMQHVAANAELRLEWHTYVDGSKVSTDPIDTGIKVS